jgi:ABC-type phosphate/phosphonate transport system substrate-binding protein
LAAGRVDMAWLDAAAYAPVSGQVRALLTVRAGAQSNRIPIYVAVRADDPARDLAALRGRRIAFGGRSPAGLATPRAVLSERGLPAGSFQEMLSAEGDAAVAALRGRTADAIAVHGAAWERVCRKVSPKDPDPCRDLRVLRVARPRAEAALAIRRDTPNDLRYRLIGIHMALHLEAPAAFAFAAGRSDAAEFQPAEAEALTLANLR